MAILYKCDGCDTISQDPAFMSTVSVTDYVSGTSDYRWHLCSVCTYLLAAIIKNHRLQEKAEKENEQADQTNPS